MFLLLCSSRTLILHQKNVMKVVGVDTRMTQWNPPALMASRRPAVVIFNLLGYVSQQQQQQQLSDTELSKDLLETASFKHMQVWMHNTLAHRLRLCLSDELVYEQNNKSCTVPIKFECGKMKHRDFLRSYWDNLNIFCRICSVNVLMLYWIHIIDLIW